MNSSFGAEQLAVRDDIRAVLAATCTPDDVRASLETDTGRSPQRWQALAELGVLGVAVPQELGGRGLDESWLVLLLEEAGRAALPEPLGEVLAATGLIVDAAPESLRQEWLPRIISGEVIAVMSLAPGATVDDAHIADLLLVVEGGALHVLDPSTAQLSPAPSADPSRRRFTMTPRLTARSCLAHRADRAVATAADRRGLAEAAYLLGSARRLMDLAHTRTRALEHSGRTTSPSVTDQLMADLETIDSAASAVYRASRSVADNTPERTSDVQTAGVLAREAARLAGRTAVKVHGGISSAREHNLDLWLPRADGDQAGAGAESV